MRRDKEEGMGRCCKEGRWVERKEMGRGGVEGRWEEVEKEGDGKLAREEGDGKR